MNLQKGDTIRYIGKHSDLKNRLYTVKGFWRKGEVVAKDVASKERCIFEPGAVEKAEGAEI